MRSLDVVIGVAWVALNLVDAVLMLLKVPYDFILRVCSALFATECEEKHVVIVGASFGGMACLGELVGKRGVRVTLIDFKEFFEYTPGILRCYADPDYLAKLTCALPQHQNALVTGEVVSVSQGAVTVREASGVRDIAYDYLVLATGSTYQAPTKPVVGETTLAQRRETWSAAHTKLLGAASVIIIGAGAVGVELAGEILTYFPEKQVTFVDMAEMLLTGFDSRAYEHAHAWLSRKGATFRLGTPIDTIGIDHVVLKGGETLHADVVYKCVGVMPNTKVLKQALGPPQQAKATEPQKLTTSPPRKPSTSTHEPSAGLEINFGFRDSVKVNDYLQLGSHPNVYCIGDMMSHQPSSELKLGHTAELNGHLASSNILRELRGEPLLKYPEGVVGARVSPKIFCLSLGRYEASLGFNSLVITGPIAALMKWVLEWTKVACAARRPIGILFWHVADTSSCWIARTLLPTLPKRA